DLGFRETWATRLAQITERHQVGAVAARADLAEHLEAALKLVLVIGAENTGKAPALALDMRRRMAILGSLRGQAGKTDDGSDSGDDDLGFEHGFRPDHACALPRTLSEMLVGSGLGVSIRDSTGRMTRK